MHTPRLTLLRAAILSASAFGINNTWAADPAPATPNTPATADTTPALDAVIVTGTRAPERTASQSLSPIDVISGDTLRNSGSSELGTVLARLIPSINFPRPSLVDGAELARPAQLRGLSPDQVLVLVNGKRRHTGAFVNLGGATGRGSAPTDLNAIPMSSIDHIEVLRDGAAARYGSDAIAGVINIILKNSDHGGSVASEFGEYKKGDGIQRKVSGDAGTTLGKDGFFHISGEADNDDYTDRAGDDYRAASIGSTTYGEHVFRQGEPETHDGSFFFNSEYDFNDAAQFYSFGGYSKRRGETAAFYRASNASNNNPAIYPNGYLPLINGVLQDTSLVVGLRGDVLQDWHYDLSANYGKNSYGINTKTINTSLGLATPHSFDNGTLTNDQRQVTLDLSRELNVGFLPNPVSVAFGTEYLHQDYQIESGDPASYYQTGASGLGGFRDTDAGSWSRQDWAQYLDLETKFTDKWSGSVAVRHEDYSDFGNNTSGSFATRYQFTPEVAVRGSVSNGFRAPSLAQQHFTNTSSQLIGNVVQEAGTFPSDSKVAKLLGADDLKPEKSKNISVGLVLEPTSNLTFTADVYRIYIDDRITLSSNLTLNQAAINYLQANGVGDINYTTARYFTNAVNTQTDGIDLVGNYRYQFDNGVRWNSTVGYNYNHDKVTDVKANPAVLNQLGVNLQRVDRRERIGLLGDTTPEHKLTLGNDFFYGNWALHSTAVRYGEYTSYQADKVNDQTFSAAWVLDLAADYKWKNWTFTLGGDNVTDKYPEKLDPYASSGGNLAYSTFSPYGYSGAFYYGKVAYNW